MKDLVGVFRRVHRRLKPRTPVPHVTAEYFPSVGANHSATLEGGHLKIRVSDLFTDAPEEVSESLATILLCKLYRKKADPADRRVYRMYALSAHMQERGRQVRKTRARPRTRAGPRGRFYDLGAVFDALNRSYFGNGLRKPDLSWTWKESRSVLGRYDLDQDVIFISRFLDSPDVPQHVVEYIVFHEMLHVRHAPQVRGCREIVHTPAFRAEERRFELVDAAERWLEGH